jgi:hypothetical protein
MPNTYTELLKTTVGTATSSVTLNLSGISGYTDLRIVFNSKLATGPASIYMNYNSDTAGNYSITRIYGNGSSAVSDRIGTNLTGIDVQYASTGTFNLTTIDIMNYANTNVFKTALNRWNTAGDTNFVGATVSLWRNTAAITSITFSSSANFVTGSTFSLYGISNADQGAAKATGGIITEDSQYWYHTFGASGAFIPKQSLTCDILAVAGGGGGGDPRGGGGGAGGVLLLSSQSVTATSYSVTVGGGGPASLSNRGTSGVNSTFQGLTAAVGGGGGGGDSNSSGLNGGSGGGEFSSGTPGTGTVGQGNNGGSTTEPYSGSGGGGAGAVGGTSTSTAAGNGGVGTTAYNSWSLVTGIGENVSGTYYLGGGGGGGWGPSSGSGTAGVGGLGGGGNGQVQNSTAATAGKPNTGGGGGAGGGVAGSTYGTPAAGGSGVVIVRYSK